MPINDVPNQDLGNGFKLLDKNDHFFDISGQSMVSASQAALEPQGNGMNATCGRRDKAAAIKLMRRLVKTRGFAPSQVTTDQLGHHMKVRFDFAHFRTFILQCTK